MILNRFLFFGQVDVSMAKSHAAVGPPAVVSIILVLVRYGTLIRVLALIMPSTWGIAAAGWEFIGTGGGAQVPPPVATPYI